MATASDSLSNISSPRSVGISDNVNSPRRRNPRNLPSPWANIVRGESESVPAAPSSPPSSSTMIPSKDQIPDFDCLPASSYSPDIAVAEAPPDISDSGNGNAAKSKKPAWNKPSNGAAVEVSPVMGAVSWPALSESAKGSPKSSSESLKALSDGSASVSQGPVVAASPQKSVNTNANPNSTTNHQFPARQKSFKRGGGGGSANGGSSQLHPHPPPPPIVEMPQNNSPKTSPVVPGTSPRDLSHKSHNWEGGQRTGMTSQSHIGNDHQQQRNSFRRGGSGHHRGDGSNHYSHGNRQDRANHESNSSHRGFNGRDGHMQQRINQRNFVRPMQPSTAPFISPPPIRPFGNPLGFPDMASPVYYFPTPPAESLRGVPFFPAAPFAMIVPAPDPQLRTVLAKQIEYYFSPENLCKDIFLRKYMDGQGWVPISLIANFNRVKQLTNNVQFILDSVRASTIVEVQGDKIRKRNDWMNWTLLQSQSASASDPLSAGTNHGTNHEILTNRIQSIGLEEGDTANGNGKGFADAHPHAVLSKSSSAEFNYQSNTFNWGGQERLQY